MIPCLWHCIRCRWSQCHIACMTSNKLSKLGPYLRGWIHPSNAGGLSVETTSYHSISEDYLQKKQVFSPLTSLLDSVGTALWRWCLVKSPRVKWRVKSHCLQYHCQQSAMDGSSMKQLGVQLLQPQTGSESAPGVNSEIRLWMFCWKTNIPKHAWQNNTKPIYECQRQPIHDKGGSSLTAVSKKEGLEGKVFLHTLCILKPWRFQRSMGFCWHHCGNHKMETVYPPRKFISMTRQDCPPLKIIYNENQFYSRISSIQTPLDGQCNFGLQNKEKTEWVALFLVLESVYLKWLRKLRQ